MCLSNIVRAGMLGLSLLVTSCGAVGARNFMTVRVGEGTQLFLHENSRLVSENKCLESGDCIFGIPDNTSLNVIIDGNVLSIPVVGSDGMYSGYVAGKQERSGFWNVTKADAIITTLDIVPQNKLLSLDEILLKAQEFEKWAIRAGFKISEDNDRFSFSNSLNYSDVYDEIDFKSINSYDRLRFIFENDKNKLSHVYVFAYKKIK